MSCPTPVHCVSVHRVRRLVPRSTGERSGGGAWFVITTEVDDALTADPLGLRRRVLRRQRTRVSIFADYPADPTLN